MDKLNKHFLGIDPGNTGGIVLLDSNSNIVKQWTMPFIEKIGITTTELSKILLEVSSIGNVQVAVEDVHAIFGSSAKATFSFGKGVGIIQGLLVAHKIPFTLVQPKKWQKEVWAGVLEIRKPSKRMESGNMRKGSIDTKKMSLVASQRLFTDHDFRKSTRSKNPHDGLIDAALIAEYCRRKIR